VLFGIWMGTGAFRFLRSEPETDLYFGLPFTRPQLFVAGWVNNLLIFAVPLTVAFTGAERTVSVNATGIVIV